MVNSIRLLFLLLLASACKKDVLMRYVGGQSLYFEKRWTGPTAYSFAQNETLERVEMQTAIPIIVLGGTAGMATTITYKVRFESEYLALIGKVGTSAEEEFQFSTDKLTDTLYMSVMRIPALADTSLSVRIQLVAAPPYHVELEDSDELGFFKELDVVIDDIYPMPDVWLDLEDYLGEFSSRKMRVLCRELINQTYDWQEINTVLYYVVDESQQHHFGELFRDYLDGQKEAGTPVLERNGMEMKAGHLMY